MAITEFNSPFTKRATPKTINHFADVKIDDDVKLHIVKELIEPMYISDVKTAIREKKCWRVTGQIFETMSKVLVAVGGIISFSSGYYSNPALGFVAGSVSTVSLALLQFSSFSYGQNKKHGSELNILLNKLNIDSVPELNRDGSKNDDSQKATNGNEDVHSVTIDDSKEGPTPPLNGPQTMGNSTVIEKSTNASQI